MDRVRDVTAIGDSWIIMVLVGEPEVGQRHIGIGYRTVETNEVRSLHLAWHCHLKNDAISPDYFTYCVGPRLPDNRLRQMSAHCRRIWRANEKHGIPYAFSSPRDSLEPATGAFLLGPTRFGLTCASFVLAVFESAGLSLLTYDAWPSDRAGDLEWRESIIKRLELDGTASKAHLDTLRSDTRAVRYQPEEVAAGAAIAPPPADFGRATALGQQIVALLQNK